MRTLNLIAGFLLGQVALVWLFVELVLRYSEVMPGVLVVCFFVAEFGFNIAFLLLVDRERARGKGKDQVKRETLKRQRNLTLWVAGFLYGMRMLFGWAAVVRSGWSSGLVLQMAGLSILWVVLLYFLHWRPARATARFEG